MNQPIKKTSLLYQSIKPILPWKPSSCQNIASIDSWSCFRTKREDFPIQKKIMKELYRELRENNKDAIFGFHNFFCIICRETLDWKDKFSYHFHAATHCISEQSMIQKGDRNYLCWYCRYWSVRYCCPPYFSKNIFVTKYAFDVF